MSWWSDVVERARTLVMRSKEERELTDEITFHLEMETRKNIEAGMNARDARRVAELALGGSEKVKEEVRDARGTRHLENGWRDAMIAVRTLAKHPEFSIIMLLILALGIGANTTTFTLVDALLLNKLAVAHPEELVVVGNGSRPNSMSLGTPRIDLASYPVYVDLRNGAGSIFTGMYATGRGPSIDVLLHEAPGGDEKPVHPRARFVTGNFFSVLGVGAYAGRTFTDAEDRVPGGDPYVVISHDYWTQKLGANRSVVGRTITVNKVPMTIVGIAAEKFTGDVVGQPTDMWLPMMMQAALVPSRAVLDDRNASWLLMMGRLAPGVTEERARTVLRGLQKQSIMSHASVEDAGAVAEAMKDERLPVENGARGFSYYRSAYARSLLTLMVAVSLVLLVVCANVANLMLVRAVGRTREMGVRMAIGAGRGDLIRQMLTESTVLALAGGGLGLLLASWGSKALLKLAGGSSPIPLDLHLNGHVLGFTAALSLGTAMIFGLVPALRGTHVELTSTLRSGGRGVTGTGTRANRIPLGKVLVVGQVALSMVLLVGTGMLARSVARMQEVDLGMDRDHLVLARIDAARSGYKDARLDALIPALREHIARVPGVVDVTMSENGIFSGTESGVTLQVEGFKAQTPDDTVVAYDDIEPGYFKAIGARMVTGREFDARDNRTGPRVAVVNETMAKFYFPHGNAIGHHLTFDTLGAREIVGIVRDVEEQGLREDPVRRMYVPMSQLAERTARFNIEVRSAGDPALLVAPVRNALKSLDPELAVGGVDALPALISDSINQDTLVSRVVMFFGILALILTALGLYGVMAYNTTRRTSEFGLRIALGARPVEVTVMMMREAMLLVLGGVVLGVPAALLATRLLKSQIYGIGLIDLPSLLVAIIVLAASAALAGGVPALRAARSSPLTALAAE